MFLTKEEGVYVKKSTDVFFKLFLKKTSRSRKRILVKGVTIGTIVIIVTNRSTKGEEER